MHSPGTTLLAVNGTLMRGLELNANLLDAGARFVREAKTAPKYRLYSVADRHPAMLQASDGGAAISLEIWEIPVSGIAAVLQSEPAGLCIGKITLDDGAQVLGVLGEPWICETAREITRHGGWREYLAARDSRS